MATSLNDELARLRERGMTTPRHSFRAQTDFRDALNTHNQLALGASMELDRARVSLGRPVTGDNYDSPEVQRILKENAALTRAMGDKRATSARMQRTSVAGLGGSAYGGDVYNALPRFYDPLEYWDLSGLPWNIEDEGHRHKLHKWLRLYYATHHLIPILVDIFTRFPLVGMELECKDPDLKRFYEELFLDQLDYGEFLVNLGREFWVVGEAFPLGSFDEDLAIWEREELINPEDIIIHNFPIIGGREFKIKPPDYLKRIAQTREPRKEWQLLKTNYEDLIPYLLRGEHIPVSDVLLRQIANKLNDWDDHGTPILLRGLRTLLHEEKLLASQDAIAERLYSPLILAKLGIQDMGDGMPPFIPGPEELESVRDDFDIALSSDFRLLVHHFGLEVSSVFGREQMPRLGDDFDRIERRQMQVFGINPSLLSAGSNSQPYASSALQAEFMNQILKTFQNTLKKHYRERALVVAEAQEHYDYEIRGKTRIPIYETVAEYDLDGNRTFKEVPKLLVPDLTFASLDLRDEATQRQFFQNLRMAGVPIPDQVMMVGIPKDIKDLVRQYNDELKHKTIEQQRAKMETYTALTLQGLPVPMDLRSEVESVLQPGPQQPGMPSPGGGMPGAPGMPPGGAGTGPIVMPPAPPGLGPGGAMTVPGGGAPPTGPVPPGPRGTVPEVSNERRPGLTYNPIARVRVARTTRAPIDDFLDERLAEGEYLGLPFQDYVADYNEQDRDSGELADVPREEIDRLYDQWSGDSEMQLHYQAAVQSEVLAKVTALYEAEESATLSQSAEDEDKPLVLKQGQHLATKDGKERIVEEHAHKRITTVLPEGVSKYSIIDPAAPSLEDDVEDNDQDD